MNLQLPTITCQRCGYTWVVRKVPVRTCANPKCRSPRFDEPKRDRRHSTT